MSGPAADRRLLLDRHHGLARLAALGWWLLTTVGLYLAGLYLAGQLLGESGNWFWLPWLLAVLFLSQFIGRWGEAQTARLLPSGRTLELGPHRLSLVEPSGRQTFDLTRKVNHWRWWFVVRERRGGRVPNGHQCCALRLVQDTGDGLEASADLYAFLPPAAAEALRARFGFYELRRAKDGPASADAQGGRDPTFLAVEKKRWEAGAELEPADLQLLLEHLAGSLPDFNAYRS
ncbi:MAG: hypothetical protein JNK29_20380 [Anaerolineales bacterium]|nr:hypothetical protein [Anaerolineales bacterium]